MRSVGQSGGQVVIIVVPLIMKALMGQQQYKNAEGQGLDLIISTAVCALGMIIFVMIFFGNNKERVPYTSEKVSLAESIKLVFTNKNLLMVSLTKLFGFGRGVYGTVSLYIAVYLLGSKGLKLALMLPMGIGTAVGTLLVNFVLKKFSTKQTYILFCVYGASAMAILFLVSKGIGFNSNLIIPFLILNFFCGIQHGNTNVTPNIMIADCIDEMEYKTGEIRRLFRDGGAIKISRSLKEKSIKVQAIRERFVKKNLREPTLSELSQISGIDKEELSEVLNAVNPVISIYTSNDEEEGVIEIPVDDSDALFNKISVDYAVKGLSNDELLLIKYRFYEGKTQVQTAELLGISQVQVSRREKQLLFKLRQRLE